MQIRNSNSGGHDKPKPPWGFKEQNPDSTAEDVKKLIISLIVEYKSKFNRYITAIEICKAFNSHPSIRNHADYKFYLLMTLPNCPIRAKLDVDNDGNILVIQPE